MRVIVFCISHILCHFSTAYDPTLLMPYKEIQETDWNRLGNTTQCEDHRNDTKMCAVDCFTKDSKGENCVGFLQDENNCYLCKNLERSEVNSNQVTTFTSGKKLYLLQHPVIEANIHISMDEFDLNTGTFTGKGVSGGSGDIEAEDLIPGKVGQAIHLGGWILPSVSQPECFCSFYYCKGTVTVSFWARSQTTHFGHVITPTVDAGGLSVAFSTEARGWFVAKGIFIQLGSSSELSATEWSFITFVVDMDIGITTYFNSIKDSFTDVSSADHHSATDALTCDTVIIGAKNRWGHYSMNGDLDEVKYIYQALSPAAVWREYVGVEGIDLSPQLVVPVGVNYTDMDVLVDGNSSSCVNVETYHGATSGLKLFNTAADKSNFSLTLSGDNLNCVSSGVIVYGDQTPTDDTNSQFTGTFKELKWESFQNECIFSWKSQYYLPFVFVKVFTVNSRICEVVFR